MIDETPLRARLLEAVHLLVLSSFAVAQPLLSVLRTSPAFFVSHRSRPFDIVGLVLVLLLAPPLIAVAITNLVGLLGPRWRRSAQAVFVWIFCCLLALTLLSRVSHRTALMVPAAAVAAGLATVLYLRSSNVRQLLVIGALAPAVFALSFLVTAPVSLLLRPQPAAAARVESTATSPVVFILFDEFPLVSLLKADGTIDEQRYPNIAALARRATWFPNAGTVHPFTEEAVPALLSAGFPKGDAPPTATSYPNNLFTLFGSSYRVHAVERVTHMCPDSICESSAQPVRSDGAVGPLTKVSGAIYLRIILPGRYPSQPGAADPFGEFLPPQNPAENPPPNAEEAPPGTVKAKDTETVVDPQKGTPRNDRVDKFIADIDSQDRTLHFLHVLIPHAPFEYLPSGRRYDPGPPLEGLRGEFWDSQEDWFATFNWQRHLLQVGYVDHVVGQLMARLDQLGILDKSMIVITADHGAAYRPGQAHRRAQEGNKYEIGLVPLFIKAPHQSAPVVQTTHIRTIDIIPTAAGMLGMKLPWVTAGRDVLTEPTPPVELRITDDKHKDSVLLDQPEAGLRAAVATRDRLFGSGGSINDLYAFGPNGDLVGQPVSGLVTSGAGEGAVHMPARPESGTVPAFVNGLVGAPAAPQGWVAIAVNGTVRATVPAMALPGDRTRFIAIVPDASFVAGDNTLTALSVTGSGDQRRVEVIPNWTYLGTRLPP